MPLSFGTPSSTALFGWSIPFGAILLQWPLFLDASLDCECYHFPFAALKLGEGWMFFMLELLGDCR